MSDMLEYIISFVLGLSVIPILLSGVCMVKYLEGKDD